VSAMSSTPRTRTDLPKWAQQVDNDARADRMRDRGSGYLGSIVVDALLLYAAHHLLDWQVGWITPTWSAVLWAVDVTLEISMVANVLLLFIGSGWLRRVVGAISCAIAAVATGWVYAIFPFDFGSAVANDVARFGLLGLTFGTAIAALVMVVLAMLEFLKVGRRRETHVAEG
jgi:hypothetical protein